MARTEVFDAFPYSEDPEHNTIEDYELWQRMLFNGVKATNIPEPLLAYRIHNRSVTVQKKGKDKANLFCKASLSKHLDTELSEQVIAVIRGKRSYPLKEARALFQHLKQLFFEQYSCSTPEKEEINRFEARVLSEIAFKNLTQRKHSSDLESIKFLLSSPQSRIYLHARVYNKFMDIVGR